MKPRYYFLLLGAALLAIAASVKISDLTLSTNPSTNTFIEIADMNAATKSGKYLLSNLVTQAQLPAGGETIWTTNADGVISPIGTGQLTNTLRFTSGLTDNATNTAFIVDTANDWTADDEEKLQAWRHHGTNTAYLTQWGALELGRSVVPYWQPDYSDSIVAIHDASAGESTINYLVAYAIEGLDPTNKVAGMVFQGDSSIPSVNWKLETDPTEAGGTVFEINLVPSDNSYLTMVMDNGTNQEAVKWWPSKTSGDLYTFASAFPTTDATLLSIKNSTNKQFSVIHNGSITTGGNTNRWILGGATNGAPDVNVDGTHYALASVPSPSWTQVTPDGTNAVINLSGALAGMAKNFYYALSTSNYVIFSNLVVGAEGTIAINCSGTPQQINFSSSYDNYSTNEIAPVFSITNRAIIAYKVGWGTNATNVMLGIKRK